jgi:hypothetical protein
MTKRGHDDRADAAPPPFPRSQSARRPANNRSRVSNGTALFLDGVPVDGRSQIARRFADHIADLTDQIGGESSPAQVMLIRNAATLATLLELDQAKVANGEPVENEAFLGRIRALSAVLRQLGVKPLPRTGDRAKIIDHDEHTAALIEDDDDDSR